MRKIQKTIPVRANVPTIQYAQPVIQQPVYQKHKYQQFKPKKKDNEIVDEITEEDLLSD